MSLELGIRVHIWSKKYKTKNHWGQKGTQGY